MGAQLAKILVFQRKIPYPLKKHAGAELCQAQAMLLLAKFDLQLKTLRKCRLLSANN